MSPVPNKPPSEAAKEEAKKKKRLRPARTCAGRSITLWDLLGKMDDFNKNRRQGHGPGHSLYVDFNGPRGPGPRHVSLLWLIRLQFQTIVDWAFNGRIHECIYLEAEPRCRCRQCDKARVKKPRGPKKLQDGTYDWKYRGAMSMKELLAKFHPTAVEVRAPRVQALRQGRGSLLRHPPVELGELARSKEEVEGEIE